jgi:DNA-binding GntR family transcriptional regulator
MDRLIPGPTLITRAYDAILTAICDGRLAPGTRLTQDELADRLHVSRQPVAQAVSVLKAQGFLRERGRRGVIIPPLEREFFRAVYQLREALDPMAARLAAQRCTRQDAAAGRRLLAAGRQAVRNGRTDRLISADAQFHVWVYRLSANPLLLETMELYWKHLRRAMHGVLRRRSTRNRIWDEHQAILGAIVAGDPEAAAALSLAHVHDAADRVVQSIPEAPDETGFLPMPDRLAARRTP